jgi:hypothetical protein
MVCGTEPEYQTQRRALLLFCHLENLDCLRANQAAIQRFHTEVSDLIGKGIFLVQCPDG